MCDLPPTTRRLTSAEPKPRRHRPKTTARGYGWTHQKLRRQVFAEQQFICGICREHVCEDLHHLNKDPHDTRRENLLGICKACHRREHNAPQPQ